MYLEILNTRGCVVRGPDVCIVACEGIVGYGDCSTVRSIQDFSVTRGIIHFVSATRAIDSLLEADVLPENE